VGIPRNVLKIITVYDLVWLRFPETTTAKNLLLHRLFARQALSAADKVVVISRSTGDDLVQFLGTPVEKIKVVYPGIHERYRPQDPERAAAYISAKYSVPRCYMATVGTVEPRKNLKVFVKVLGILKSNGKLNGPLLIAGARGWKNSDLYEEIQTAGLTEAAIRFLGYLPDEDLPFFYSGAQVFLFPSFYEGFGIPPVEAMACGVPVISSNARCMPEVLGDAAILVPPTDAEGMADAILKALGDEKLRYSMRAAGIQRAEIFDAEACAREMMHVISEAGAEHG
jgi:glycosyltransferase involved in cell wall biosynthesis